jgi:hypothetical protein
MVFVSNESSGSMIVSITNKSGGSASNYTIGARQLENYSSNHWQRTGNEVMMVQFSAGKSVKINVGKDDNIRIYDDCYERSVSEVVRLDI